MRIRNAIVGLVTVASLLTGCRSKEEIRFSMDPEENIEALWQIIDTKYCYIDTKGSDWSAIHGEYVTKAAVLQKSDQLGMFD